MTCCFVGRKRRATENLGSSVDGFVQASLPAINQTLVKAALKVQVAFKTVLDKFTQSVKLLLNGFVDISKDSKFSILAYLVFKSFLLCGHLV